jgi:hypothetical protein
VQAELTGEFIELFLRGGTEVRPYQGVGLFEVRRNVCDAEAVRLEHPRAVHPGRRIGHRILLPQRRDLVLEVVVIVEAGLWERRHAYSFSFGEQSVTHASCGCQRPPASLVSRI